MRRRLISWEGGEASGKTTQIRLLAQRLRDAGADVVCTREPGGTPIAERLRSLILSGALRDAGPEAEALAFAAARADHVQRLIAPALDRGAFVLTDRFFDSTRVYQLIGGADIDVIKQLEDEAVGDCRPGLTLILDVDETVSHRRSTERRGGGSADRFEGEGRDFHRQVRQGFLDVARSEPARCVVVPAEQSIDAVSDLVWEAVTRAYFTPRSQPLSLVAAQ